jgi:hypothetical protein
MKMRGGGLLILALAIFLYIGYGEWAAGEFSKTTKQVVLELAPIFAPVILFILVVLVVKFYWQRRF